MVKILVLCTGNSCRSQMAEAYLRYFANGRAEIYSAGIEAHGVNPTAIKILMEDGIDISGHSSNLVSEYENIVFDYVITVCDNAKEKCPYFPATVGVYHRNFKDPSKVIGNQAEVYEQFRLVRQEIKEYCKEFIEKVIE
jgi:arsenate reductase